MARAKYDGMIEAVRYAVDGTIDVVRMYERRGATFSDRILLNRAKLLERLKMGEKFVTGQRQEFLASTFETTKVVQLLGDVIATAPTSGRDWLEEVPFF